jgi:antitoxin VapB
MTLEIHGTKANALAQTLASATGEDIDTAVLGAIEERLARLPQRQPLRRDADVDAVFERLAAMPVLYVRSADEIIGYDANGLPG